MRVKVSKILKLLFLMIYISKYLTDSLYVSRKLNSPLLYAKYVFAIAFIIIGILVMFEKSRILHYNTKEQYTMPFAAAVIVSGILLLITLAKMFFKQVFYTDVFTMIFKIMLPALIVLVAADNFDGGDIYSIMKVLLLFGFVSYILQIGISTFSLSNIRRISFLDSASPFESHYFNSVAIMSCCFFNYYRKNKWLGLFSTLFVFSTFKRISIVFAIFLFVVPFFVNLNRPINRNAKYLFATFFIFFTIVYYYMIQPENWYILSKITGQDVDLFTMGRSAYISRLSSGFLNYGIGSTERFLGKSIEMDLIQILIETSIIGLSVFCFAYWNTVPDNLYATLFMSFLFLNMIMSHSLSDGFSWGTNFLIVYCMKFFPASYEETDRTLIHMFKEKHILHRILR